MPHQSGIESTHSTYYAYFYIFNLCLDKTGVVVVSPKDTWEKAQQECLKNKMFPSSVQKINHTLNKNGRPYTSQYWTGVMRQFTIVRAHGRQLTFDIPNM